MATVRKIVSKDQLEQLKKVLGPGVIDREARLFRLVRHTDPTGVSGTGTVAEGVEFSDGIVVMRWLSGTPTTTVYDSVDDLKRIHGHHGATTIEWMTK